MKNILSAPPVEITRTIKEKLLIILWTWFLLIFVYQNILYRFLVELNESGKIHFGAEFNPSQLIWGEQIFPNIIKIIVDLCIALLGGITVGYLVTRARISFKFFYSFFSTIFQLFFSVAIIILITAFAYKGNSNEGIGTVLFIMLEAFRSQPLYLSFIVSGFVLVFLGYYQGINLGMKFREENVFDMDLNRRDTFLDIKWFHWLWFWIPVGIYLKIILWIIFNSLLAVFQAIRNWKILEFIGIYSADRLKEPPRSIGDIIWWGFLAALVFFYQLKFIWDILTGHKTFRNKYVSFFLVFLFSFVTPFLIMGILYWLGNRK